MEQKETQRDEPGVISCFSFERFAILFVATKLRRQAGSDNYESEKLNTDFYNLIILERQDFGFRGCQ